MAKEYDITTIKKAIKNSKGLYTVIAKKLRCEWHTAKKYVEMFDETKEAYNSELEKQLDITESKLFENIDDNDDTAIIFYLKTKGKHRGYVERSEVTGPDGTALNIIVQSKQAADEINKLG